MAEEGLRLIRVVGPQTPHRYHPDSKIEIDYGLIARTTRNIPLAKIQDVTVSASIPQRILGFGDVVVDNASELGGTTILHNIDDPRHYADLLLRELRHRH